MTTAVTLDLVIKVDTGGWFSFTDVKIEEIDKEQE